MKKTAEYLQNCEIELFKLPASEIKYHLLLLIAQLKNKKYSDNHLIFQMAKKLDFFIKKLNCFSQDPSLAEEIAEVFQDLVELSKTARLNAKIINSLIQIGSGISAFTSGLIGGLIGGIAGFCRGIFNLKNPLYSFGVGLITGILLGGVIGYRIPQKIIMNDLTQSLKICLESLRESLISLEDFRPFIEHAEQKLLNYFDNNLERYNDFLNREWEYEIITTKAQFVSPSLEGYLGHHALIKLDLKEAKPPLLIEFTNEPSDLSRSISQREIRRVKGFAILEMLALHECLQITHACTLSYMFKKLKPGENDCLSYINKILIGTNQKATRVRRFDGKENVIGHYVIGFFIQKLSPFKQDVFDDSLAFVSKT